MQDADFKFVKVLTRTFFRSHFLSGSKSKVRKDITDRFTKVDVGEIRELRPRHICKGLKGGLTE